MAAVPTGASRPQALLTGMRVVEVSAFVAAPLGGMTLAQLGADVIRIDPPQGGLDYRRWPVTQDNVSLFWCGMNKGKRSVAIDTSIPEGQELVQAIVCAPGADAGIFLSNLPPTGWRAHAALVSRRADLIQLTLQGNRNGGSAIDPTVNCAVGVPYITGPGDAEAPVNHQLPAWDLITGQTIATCILAAERHRLRTGQGQHVLLSLEDVALATMSNLGFLAEAALGIDRQRHGNYIFGTFGRDFLCADGVRIMVVAVTHKQWRGLRDLTGLQEPLDALASRLKLNFDDEGDRFRAKEGIADILAGWFTVREFAEVKRALDGRGACWGRYGTVREMVESDPACSTENPMFGNIVQPGVGPLLSNAHPARFGLSLPPALPAPNLGMHTEQVLSEVVGLTSAEIGRLSQCGVIGIGA